MTKTSASGQVMDKFFNLGNKVTSNNPVQKAKFDYNLYWVVFLTFLFLSFNYFYTFYKTGALNSLGWGLVILIFSWFNYWALVAFRTAYLNMKAFYSKPKQETQDDKDFKEMFNQKN